MGWMSVSNTSHILAMQGYWRTNCCTFDPKMSPQWHCEQYNIPQYTTRGAVDAFNIIETKIIHTFPTVPIAGMQGPSCGATIVIDHCILFRLILNKYKHASTSLRNINSVRSSNIGNKWAIFTGSFSEASQHKWSKIHKIKVVDK